MASKPRYRYEGTDERTGKPRLRQLPAGMFEDIPPLRAIPKGQQATGDIYLQRFLDADPGKPDATYEPTATINPSDPRTSRMAYWKDLQVMRVEWGDGGRAYNYYEVTSEDWRSMIRVKSPGRAINRRFNSHPYGPAQ